MSEEFSSEVFRRLPPLECWDRLQLKDGDTIIHAPGFEDRTTAIAEGLVSSPGAQAILLEYAPYNAKNRLTETRNSLASLQISISDDAILKYDRFDPGDFETRLLARLGCLHTRRAIVDISTMSKLAIMLVLRVCHQMNLDTVILYSEAKEYGPSEQEFKVARERNEIHRPTLHVFNGIHGVVRVESLSSVAMQGQPTAAIVFMSFNDSLTQLLLNTVYPSRLFLINGRPPIHSWRERATAWVHEEVRKEWEEDNPVNSNDGDDSGMPLRNASTLDYRVSLGLLLDLYWQLSANHRLLLAPSGSKMQTVACYLAKASHLDIHIEYPSPEGFAPEYSKGIGDRWLVNLGPFSKTLGVIEEVERRAFLEIAI
jgi:hypothetical protein